MLRRLLWTTDDVALTVARVALGSVMFPHGAQKMLGWFGGAGFSQTLAGFEHSGIPAPFALLAILAEFFGSIGLIVGLLGRIAALGVFSVMTVAILKVHAANGLFMNWTGQQKGEGFEFHLLAIGLAVAVMLRGSGALSVDLVLGRRSGPGPHSQG